MSAQNACSGLGGDILRLGALVALRDHEADTLAVALAEQRDAIEEVLLPDTLDTHKERLHAAGFSQVLLWFQCFNFVSLLAVK